MDFQSLLEVAAVASLLAAAIYRAAVFVEERLQP